MRFCRAFDACFGRPAGRCALAFPTTFRSRTSPSRRSEAAGRTRRSRRRRRRRATPKRLSGRWSSLKLLNALRAAAARKPDYSTARGAGGCWSRRPRGRAEPAEPRLQPAAGPPGAPEGQLSRVPASRTRAEVALARRSSPAGVAPSDHQRRRLAARVPSRPAGAQEKPTSDDMVDSLQIILTRAGGRVQSSRAPRGTSASWAAAASARGGPPRQPPAAGKGTAAGAARAAGQRAPAPPPPLQRRRSARGRGRWPLRGRAPCPAAAGPPGSSAAAGFRPCQR